MPPIYMQPVPPVYIDRSQRNSRGIPESMICPITYEVMRDPVVLRVRAAQGGIQGERFERSAITRYLQTTHHPLQSPATRRDVTCPRLQPDAALRRRINRTLKFDRVFLEHLTPAQKCAISQAFARQIPKHHAAAQILISQVPADGAADAFLADILLHCSPRPSARRQRSVVAHTGQSGAWEAPRTAPLPHRPGLPPHPRALTPWERSYNSPAPFHMFPINVYFDSRSIQPPNPPFAFDRPFGSIDALGRYVFEEFNRRQLHVSNEQAARMQNLANARSWEDLLLGYHVHYNSVVVPAQRTP